jgi:hypothetical protein
MTGESSPAARSLALRVMLLAPTAASAGAALALLVASPFAWGKAEHVGIPPWMTTASGVALGAPALVTSGWASLDLLLRRARGMFFVSWGTVALGATFHAVMAAVLVALAGTIASSSTYDSLQDQKTSPAGFFFLTIGAAIVATLMLAGVTVMYVTAIEAGHRSRKFDRQPDEPDFLEQWTRRRR